MTIQAYDLLLYRDDMMRDHATSNAFHWREPPSCASIIIRFKSRILSRTIPNDKFREFEFSTATMAESR